MFRNSTTRTRLPSSVVVGQRFDAKPVELCWPFLPHSLVSGVTGSGKSSWTASLIGGIAQHRNTAICGIDLKGGVELSAWKPRLTTLAATPNEAADLLSSLQGLINHRAEVLEMFGRRAWDFDLGPAVLVVIDELAELAALDSAAIADALADPVNTSKTLRQAKDNASLRIHILASLCRLARFAAVTIICATQYPLASVVPSELRSNLTGRIAGRVTAREQIDVALGAGMSTNIAPDAIAADEPGVAYLLGYDGYTKPTRCRAFYPTDTDISNQANNTAPLRISPEDLFDVP